ncbi:hypothetical protein Lesp02_82270 [Lentzea sp. NBRC 105346]|uniref:serine/threonine-protein kinase n=1 Tax=Lentzea sp. NBRC 105346 TaxID=3032205 RepID=UPI0024A09521|nr:serine/threonine-protein kinase [Lentzea sp. NBRC 105346]GLZ36040.1 hypothetical protein Lesp02_82270 [Lentzea sp. NBRC 105346]
MSETEGRQVAGRYRLRERLGHGAMGVVWHGYDEQLHRVVAIKELLVPQGDDEKADRARHRAMREARLAARLEHPNAIRVYDAVEEDGQPWLVMEYMPNRSLADIIAEQGELPPKEVALIGCQIAHALAAAHRHKILHRDVKPANILVGDQDVKITDFGISRLTDDGTATLTGTNTVGTPAFFSPEVARGEQAGFSSDVFSLGATLYNAVEGTPPFGKLENTIQMLHKVAGGEYRRPEKAGPLLPVLEQMLQKDPDARPTMEDCVKLLAEVYNGDDEHEDAVEAAMAATLVDAPAPARPEVDPTRPAAYIPIPREEEPRRKAAPLIIGAVIVLLLIAGLGAWSLWGKKQQTATPPSTSSSQQPTSSSSPQTGGSSQPTTQPPTTTTTTTTPPAQQPPPAQAQTAAQALVDYYNIIPENLDAGWARLTDNFKQGRGLTREGYDSHWNQFNDVVATDLVPQGDNVVTATVTATYKTGGNLVERHTFTLVQQNGQWLIEHQG